MKNGFLKMHYGLAHRITLLVTGTVLFMVGALCLWFVFSETNKIHERAQNEVQEVLNVSATIVGEPLWYLDTPAVKIVLETVISGKNGFIRGGRVYTAAGETLVEKIYAVNEGLSYEQVTVAPGSYAKTIDITYRGRVLGKLEIVASHDLENKKIADLIGVVSLFLLMVSISVSTLVFLVLRRTLSEPLSHLLKGISGIAKAEYSSQLNLKYPYELGWIAKEYNQAVREISGRDHQLRQYAETLESRVEQKTNEIAQHQMRSENASRLSALGELAAGVAHEINNPLAVILGEVEILKIIAKDSTIEVKVNQEMTRVADMVKRISRIVSSLKEFGRDGSRDQAQPFSIAKSIGDVADVFKAKILRQQVDLQINIENGDFQLLGRSVQVSQALLNLINNSIEAIDGMPNKWIKIDARREGDRAIIGVTDSGEGIPADLHNKILQPFFTTKEFGKASGLGLSSSLGLIQANGGELYLVRDSKHTRFEFTIPLAPAKTRNIAA